MNEDGRIEMLQDDYDELSDLIYDALGDGIFGDGLIDQVHEAIMHDLKQNIDIVDGDEEED